MDGGLDALLAEDSGDSDDGADCADELVPHDAEDGEGDEEKELSLEEAIAETVADVEDADSEEEEEDMETSEDIMAMQSEMQQHQAQLDELKKKDPEFFNFLEHEDRQLLDFEDDEDDNDDGSDEEDEPMSDDSEKEDSATKKKTEKKRKTKADKRTELTKKTVRAWGKLVHDVSGV